MIIGIISPYSGDIEANKTYLKAIMASILDEGHEPVAGHAMYPAALDDNDPEQRAKGMKAGREITRQLNERLKAEATRDVYRPYLTWLCNAVGDSKVTIRYELRKGPQLLRKAGESKEGDES
jgi:hypothetical protein